MPINVPLLQQAISEGTTEYLRDTQFTTGLFAAHGEEGRGRAQKVQKLLQDFTTNANNLSPEDLELRVLALADALFIIGSGPTLRKCIYQKLKVNGAIDDGEINQMFSEIHSVNDYGLMFVARFSDKIQKEIQRRTGASEPSMFRQKRLQCLSYTSALLNVEMFNVYSKIENNENAQTLSVVTTTSCSIL